MSKVIKKLANLLLHTLSGVVLAVILLILTLAIAFSLPRVQSLAASKVVGWLSGKTNVEISIGAISIENLTRLTAENLYVEDLRGDTLLWVGKASALIDSKALLGNGGFVPRNVEAERVVMNLNEDAEYGSNIDTLINQILSHFPADTTTTSSVFAIEGAKVRDMRFRFYDPRFAGRTPATAIDYSDMDIHIASADFGKITIDGSDVILSDIENLNVVDRSGAGLQKSSLGSLTIGDALLDFRTVDFRSGGTRLNLPHLIIKGNDWKEYSNFCDKVTLSVDTRNSSLEPASAGKFVAELGYYATEGESISGIFEGTVNNFVADIAARLYDSDVIVIGEVKNLLHLNNLTADTDLYLDTTPTKVATIYESILHTPLPESIASNINRFDLLSLDGRIVYTPGRLLSDALLTTNLGEVDVKGVASFGGGRVGFDGRVSGSDINVGAILEEEQLGMADLGVVANLAVADGRVNGTAKASVERFGWNNYDFGNISLEASMEEGIIRATANSTDPNVSFSLEGESNIDTAQPEVNLILNAERVDFSAIGIAKPETTSWLSANMEASLTGSRLDDMVGRAMITNLTYASAADTLSTELVNIALAGGPQSKSFSLFSPIANIEYRSNASYGDVATYLTKTLPASLPLGKDSAASEDEGEGTEGNQNGSAERYGSRLYTADDYSSVVVNIKEGEALAAVLIPEGNLAPDSSLSIEFSPKSEEFALLLESDYIAVEDFVVSNLRIEGSGEGDNIHLSAESNEIITMGMAIPDIGIEATASTGNNVGLSLFFSNTDSALSGRLDVAGKLARNGKNELTATASLDNSFLISRNQRWEIGARKIDYAPNHIAIDNFRIGNSAEELLVNGVISNSPSELLSIRLTNISIGEWVELLASQGGIEGYIDGTIALYSLLQSPNGGGVMVASSLNAGGVEVDPLELGFRIPRGSSEAVIGLSNNHLDTRLATARYDYLTHTYGAEVNISSFELSLLNQLLGGTLSGTMGNGSVALSVEGQGNSIDIDGGINIENFATKVDFTGASYSAKELAIRFEDNKGIISPVRVEDGEGGWAEVAGYVDLSNLNSIGYGVSLEPHNLVAIDLAEGNPNGFYGKVYASGGARLTATPLATTITGAITTDGGSVFNLPLRGNNDFAGAEFVTFVDHSQQVAEDTTHLVARKKNELLGKKKRQSTESNTTVDLTLGVGTDTQLRLIIDPETENVIAARGVAELGITLDSRKNDISVRGDYQISEGYYDFNFQNLITKRFTINPDSYIRWSGDPLDANIDIGATYKLKTSLAPLLGGGSTASRSSTPVDCIVNLTGQLSRVDVSFDINVPTANTEYQSILSSYFSSQEMMATQFVYLLALGNFYSDTGASATTTAGAAGTAIGLDFLASQVSKLVSNDAYKFNLKYKAIDDTSSSYSVDFQTAIIDDRLLLELEANVDTGDYYQSINGDNNQLSGGGAITLMLDNSGDFYIKGFSRTIDRFDENQGLQENGIGLYYKRSFERLGDLWRKKSKPRTEGSEKSGIFADSPAPANTEGAEATSNEQPEEATSSNSDK